MKQSLIVREQIPQYIKDNYDVFISFLEAYYEFLEQGNNANQILSEGNNLNDIDYTLESFVDYFMNSFASTIPSYIQADKRLFLKHSVDLFKSKGTEKSYKLLFNILYGDNDIQIQYPKQYILKASDGKWSQERSIKITNPTGNPFDLEGKIITGATSGATAGVEKVFAYQSGNISLYELFLSFGSIEGTFSAGEIISNNGINGITVPVITKLNITAGGTGYSVDDVITITGTGYDAVAKIVDVDNAGSIKKIEMINFGAGWSGTPSISITGGSSATVSAVIGAYGVYPGKWIGSDGKLSDVMKIFDGYYYQNYSYVIRAKTEIKFWRDIVKQILHPAGLQMFGELFNFTKVQMRAWSPASSNSHYDSSLLRRIITIFSAVTFRSVILETYVSRTVNLKMDRSDWKEIDKLKFKFFPNTSMTDRGTFASSTAYNMNDIVLSAGKYYRCIIPYTSDSTLPASSINWSRWNTTFQDTTNSGYFNSYSNIQIKDFANVLIKDASAGQTTYIQTEPYLSITK